MAETFRATTASGPQALGKVVDNPLKLHLFFKLMFNHRLFVMEKNKHGKLLIFGV